MNWAAIWPELRPILGPLIQAAVVLIVGYFTLRYQARQAKTAEQKLFTELHDKRYKALTAFTHDVTELVLEVIYSDDTTTPPFNMQERQRQSRLMFARMQELEWLFGDDVMTHVQRMYGRAEMILNLVNQLRHQLKEDDKVAVVDAINEHNDDLYDALGHITMTARQYLYVGDIKAKPAAKESATHIHIPELPSAKKLTRQRDALGKTSGLS